MRETERAITPQSFIERVLSFFAFRDFEGLCCWRLSPFDEVEGIRGGLWTLCLWVVLIWDFKGFCCWRLSPFDKVEVIRGGLWTLRLWLVLIWEFLIQLGLFLSFSFFFSFFFSFLLDKSFLKIRDCYLIFFIFIFFVIWERVPNLVSKFLFGIFFYLDFELLSGTTAVLPYFFLTYGTAILRIRHWFLFICYSICSL